MRMVTPWEIKNFKHSTATLRNIKDNLERLNYPLKAFNRRPIKRDIAATHHVIKLLQELNEAKEMPWLLMFTNSTPLAQALAQTVPMTHALTTAESCYTTDNAELTELFKTPSPKTPFEYDEPGERLEEITTAGLLFWRDLDVKTFGALHQSGRFLRVLNYRMEHKMETVFSVVRNEVIGKQAVPIIMETVSQNLGETVSYTIQDNAEVRMLTVPHEATNQRSYGELKL